ncbi:GerMN domain-containing protein [Cohnella cellulosilytica]|uniref:GerMN domain-containing protein n=1 Tax=Cohnella cellulosilytica TaxID=986710 RepID=A0ABW2FAJ7_9BACL
MKTYPHGLAKLSKWALLLALVPLMSACSVWGGSKEDKASTTSIDPPPRNLEEVWIQGAEEPAAADQGEMITVYLLDRNEYLAPMSLRVDREPASPTAGAETALAWMTANRQLADQLPPGFAAVLPEGTKVNTVTENAEERTISVDFAAPFPGIPASRERTVIEALVWTLTELPGIDKVKLSIAGKPIRSMPSSGLPVDTVLTRGLGINLEKIKDVQPTYAMGVTLYFASQTAEGEGYFVPVTRLVHRQEDAAKAALEQLIAGPQDTKSLQAVLEPDISVEKLVRMADTVNVALKDADGMPKPEVPSRMMEALVLTLTEAAGLPQVSVVMNGDDSFLDSEQRSYDRPVARPLHINALPQ